MLSGQILGEQFQSTITLKFWLKNHPYSKHIACTITSESPVYENTIR